MKRALKKSIPKQRLLLYWCLIGLLPAIGVLSYDYRSRSELKRAEALVQESRQIVLTKQTRQAFNALAKRQFQGADRHYIAHHLESFVPLAKETEDLLQLLREDPSLPNRELLSRLKFLQGENRIRFSESAVEMGLGLKETVESLSRPIEIDQSDLPALLSRIESIPLSQEIAAKPQLTVTDLKLQRKTVHGDNEVFLLDMKILKREFQS